jgi:hypothetical protein
MPSMHGSFVGKIHSQAMVTVRDAPNHELGLMQLSGPQMVSDPLLDGATVSYSGMADLVSGNGTQTGYYVNQHPNGDTDYGTFKATITTADGAVTLEGTWQCTGGTGALARISGSGTYKGAMVSPTEVETKWEGSYQLGWFFFRSRQATATVIPE